MREPERVPESVRYAVEFRATLIMTNSPKLTIAIDGPAGAGKSTLASRLARKLGYINLESGGMYRALALKAIERDLSFDNEDDLMRVTREITIGLEPTTGGNRVLVNGVDVSERIRARDVTEAASRVSVHPKVRAWMVARQQELGAGGGVVMEGRDIGTVVFPQAELKVFLDADPDARAERRMAQQLAAGTLLNAEATAEEMRARDTRDKTRMNSPLAAASDAVHIDTTGLTEDEVLAKLVALAQAKIAELG